MYGKSLLLIALNVILLSFGNIFCQELKIPDFPEFKMTPAGRCPKAYIDAFNDDNIETMRNFNFRYRSPSVMTDIPVIEQLNRFSKTQKQFGKLKVASLKVYSDYEVEIIAQSTLLGLWLCLNFSLEEKPPNYLKNVLMTPSGSPLTGVKEYKKWKNLRQLLDNARKDSRIPAIAAVIVREDRIIEKAITGVRQFDKRKKAEITDCFHLGSVTKSMTATMIARLIELGIIRWETTIGNVFSNLTMHPDFTNVTVKQLLDHLGGIPSTPLIKEPASENNLTPTEKRAKLTERILKQNPVVKPGTSVSYSNTGYTIAAHMAEFIAHKPYEDLMREYIFAPLNLTSTDFGWAFTVKNSQQPRGHIGEAPDFRVQTNDEFTLDAYFAPAGDIHCSIDDLGKFALLHLRGLLGKEGILKPETMKYLHTPLIDDRENRYAGGWMIDSTEDGKPVHRHTGSAGTFFAQISLFPENNLAVAVLTNAGLCSQPVVYRIIGAIYERMK